MISPVGARKIRTTTDSSSRQESHDLNSHEHRREKQLGGINSRWREKTKGLHCFNSESNSMTFAHCLSCCLAHCLHAVQTACGKSHAV